MDQINLNPIEELIGARKFDEAEVRISATKNPTLAKYYRGKILFLQEKYDDALNMMNPIITEQTETSFPYYKQVLELKIKSLHFKGDYNESHDHIQELRSHPKFLENYLTLIAVDMGNYLFLGDFPKVIEIGIDALKLSEIEKNQEEKMKVLKNIGTSYFQMGKYPEANNYFDQALEINKTIDNANELAILYNNIGLVNYAEGNLDKALEMYELAVQEFKNLKLENKTAVVYSNIALIYQGKNQFNLALEHMNKSLKLQEKLGNKYYISICQTNLARIYIDKGNLHQANQLLLKSLEINEELDNEYLLAESYTEYGQLLYRKGQVEQSRDLLNKALHLREKIGDRNMISYTLYIIIKNEINHDFEIAEKYFKRLEGVVKDFDNKYAQIRLKLSKALMLQHSKRLKHQSQAQMIYEDLLSQEQIHYDFTMDIIQNLFEIITQEIMITKEYSLIENLEELMHYMTIFSRDQNSVPLEVKSLVLHSKLEFLKGNMTHAKSLMRKALDIAENNDLNTLNVQITMEFNKLVENIYQSSNVERLRETNVFDKELLKTVDTFIDILDNRIDFDQIQRNENPQLFFILTHGEIVYDRKLGDLNYTSLRDEILRRETELFASNVKRNQTFELLKIDHSFVIVTSINEIMIGFVYEGYSYSAIHKFNTILAIIRSSEEFQEFLTGKSSLFTPKMDDVITVILNDAFDSESGNRDDDEVPEGGYDMFQELQVVKPLPILKNYELLLHPIRLIVIKLLTSYYSIQRSHLLKLTGLNSGTLKTHLDVLEKFRWISKEIEFVNDRPRTILYIEPEGKKTYQEFTSIFKEYILEE